MFILGNQANLILITVAATENGKRMVSTAAISTRPNHSEESDAGGSMSAYLLATRSAHTLWNGRDVAGLSVVV